MSDGTTSTSPPKASAPRTVFVDVLRLLATFQMVQGHTLDAVLATSARTGALHDMWQSARGLTAVSFLFAAGLSFQLTTLTKLERYRASPELSARRVLRALRLIAIGYLLHLPLALLWTHEAAVRDRIIRDFVSVDVLQCIGVSLLALELAVKVIPTVRGVATVAALLGALALFGAAFTRTLPVHGPAAPILNYVSALGGSIFPLLPWAGHLWLGVGVAQFANGRFRARLLLVVAVLGAGWLLLSSVAGWETTAMHLGRLGLVCLVCAGLAWLVRSVDRLPRWMERLAGETLTVYVFHIVLVYGAGVGLATTIGPSLSVPVALLVTLLVLGASVVLALGLGPLWSRLALAAPSRKR